MLEDLWHCQDSSRIDGSGVDITCLIGGVLFCHLTHSDGSLFLIWSFMHSEGVSLGQASH
jgi:hypothetical protein